MANQSQLTVIIVTYNNQETIADCLDSILKYQPDCEVVVVDNNSQDQTLKVLAKYLHITLIKSAQNLGFSKGNNLAASAVKTKYLCILNPDTRLIKKNSLGEILTELQKNPEYGLIGPKLVLTDQQVQKSVRNLPTAQRAFQEYVLEQKGVFDFYQPKSEKLTTVESVVGACMVVSIDLFNQAGRFDERYFLYFEDLQLCKNIQKLGKKIGYLPSVTLSHVHGASGGGKTNSYIHKAAKTYHGLFEYHLIQFFIRLGRLRYKLMGSILK